MLPLLEVGEESMWRVRRRLRRSVCTEKQAGRQAGSGMSGRTSPPT